MQRKYALYLVTALLSLSVLEGVFYDISLCIPEQYYYKPPPRAAFLHYLASDIDWEVGWRPQPDELSAAGYQRTTKSGHFTVKGNRILAEAAWEIIERLGILSSTN